MAYALENALFQWHEGERRVHTAPELERADLEDAVEAVIEELRRRLGSTFVVSELASYYAESTDWAAELAGRHAAGTDTSHVVDAAFGRYAREASDYGGGRARETHERP
jgi:hypothetical protein